ncbi:MAG: SEC-C domain-containing protein [Lachnospiraceae bacterium]|nr:SEC-C domain-containing protein [Lachnospiraceae bacterium]
MSLLEEWRANANNAEVDAYTFQKFWDDYFMKEKGVYAEILKTPDTAVKGTVKELADKFNITVHEMTGFLDGINDSLVKANPLEEMDENTEVSLDFDNEKLFRNMVEADAPWLYELPEWDAIYSKEEQKNLIRSQKDSHTIRKPKKIGRNDPCPCGSGKKYKQCCGRKGA